MPSTKITKIFGARTKPGYHSGTDNLAPYYTALGDILPKDLKQELRGVVAHIFPLSADPDRMQNFLDRYVNFPNGEGLEGAPPVYFKPAAPFVLLEVANYGRLSSNISNTGWFSQREIAFGMAVEWYARNGEDLKFLKYALIYPYVYVDSPLGIAGGREIYGWSKAPIEVALSRTGAEGEVPVPLAPVFDPPTEQLLFAANLLIPEKTPTSPDCRKKFMEIRQSRYLQAAASAIPDLLTAVPRAMSASLNAGWEALKFVWASREYGASQISDLSKMLPQYRGMATKYLPSWVNQTSGYRPSDDQPIGSATSIITLKQVREIEGSLLEARPNRACYQGILESQMWITGISDGGSLVELTNPDPSAGTYVDLFSYGEKMPGPLELGMYYQEVCEPSKPEQSSGASETQSPRHRLVPFLPFWVKMDLKYGSADYQAWRTNWTDWTETNTPKLRAKPLEIKYIDLGAGASQEISPPAKFPQVTMRFLPLAAKKDKIESILRGYLDNIYDASDPNGPKKYFDFIPKTLPKAISKEGDAVVIAILSNFEGMKTVGGNSNTYDDYEFTFAIPVCWKDNSNDKSGRGLVPVYTFTGTAWNAITSGEVYGRWSLQSTFISPPFTDTLPPSRDVPPVGLRVSTQFFPEGKRSEEVLDLPIVEVAASYSGLFKMQKPDKKVTVERAMEDWLKTIGLPEFAITSRADAEKFRFYGIALKQIRDGNDTKKADYQASVWLERTFILDRDIDWLNPDIELHIGEYETVSMVEKLGLRTEGYCSPRKPWPHKPPVHLVKPIRRSDKLPGSLVVIGTLMATSANIGWLRIGRDGWKRPDFTPAPWM